MTTVVDPLGTPAPVYNRSGTSIVTVVADGSGGGSPGSEVPHVSGETIVIATINGSNISLSLPSDSDIGDVVEIHFDDNNGTHALIVSAPSGQTINVGSSEFTIVGNHSGVRFRKVSASNWRAVGGA